MLLEKIVRYDIDDIASQFPKHLFDPEAISNRRSKDKREVSQTLRARPTTRRRRPLTMDL